VWNEPESPEGADFEVQYRVAPAPQGGTALWRRRDTALDPSQDAGGVAAPVCAGVASMTAEASGGASWFEAWDSDSLGFPHALRVTVSATDDTGRTTAVARRVIALDRTPPPRPPAKPKNKPGAGGAGAGSGTPSSAGEDEP
jgi:hypothetical protein